MRAFAPQFYGIPIDQVIGSEVKRESRMENDQLAVWRLPEKEAINDKEGKPIGIDRHIGKRPIFVAGNVGNYGDIASLNAAKKHGFTGVNIKSDWKTVFGAGQAASAK